MPRGQAFVVENNFINGLVTQATALTFPENACTETFNCVFDEIGKVKRRLGIDLEENFTDVDISADYVSQAYNTFEWENVSGDPAVTFIVVQAGSLLHFYRVLTPENLSLQRHATTIDLTAHDPSGAPDVGLYDAQFCDGNGLLFVSGPYLETFYVEYDISGNTLTATDITVQIRDFERLDDNLEIDERPTATVGAMDADHKYNLFNQGWYYEVSAGTTVLDEWDTGRTDLPSSADIWWFYRRPEADGATAFDLDFSLVEKKFVGNTPAPRGHYILNFYDWDRITTSGIAGITNNGEDMGANRLSTTAFFAGRLWYGGVNHPGYRNAVLFSQIVQYPDQYGKCYQSNDPTSEDLFDLLSSDGGILKIPEAGAIVKLWPMENVLLVFTLKGVWGIEGSGGLGFAANDYVVRKISSIPCLTASSFVDVDGIPMWWNEDGIFTVVWGSDSNSAALRSRLNTLSVQSLTDTKVSEQGVKSGIKVFIQAVPLNNKKYVRGSYNRSRGLVLWLFKSTEATNATENYIFDGALLLNTKTGAWFPWTFSNNQDIVQIKGISVVQSYGSALEILDVRSNTGGADNVQANTGADEVVCFGESTDSVEPRFKFLVVTTSTDMTWADERQTSYVDFESTDGVVDYASYFVTGFGVHGDAAKYFQSNYIVTHFETEQDSSCWLEARWDFASSQISNKFSMPQQVYNTQHTSDRWYVSRSKRKIRGKGRALQLKYYSETGKPFTILGWSRWETGNQGV